VAKYCQNPLCQNEAVKEVSVSVSKRSDQKRALCALCEEAYSWGVQHGRMAFATRKVWVVAVTDRGNAVYAKVVRSKSQAVKDLADYLRAHEDYSGPAELPGICSWLAEHDEHMGVDIFQASPDLG